MSRLVSVLRSARRAVLARRRVLAALLAAVAVATGLHAASAAPPARVPVVVAARDLPSGTVLASDDVRTVAFAPGSVPSRAVADPVGRTVAAPLRAGEPLTDLRLVGPPLADGYPGLVAVPVRMPDAAMAGLLHVGDRIDLVAADPQGGPATMVATGVPVLALPDPPTADSTSGLTGRLVVVGAEPSEVTRLADAGVRFFLTYAFATSVAP